MGKTGTIVTRFAPSPTGRFHVGSVRTALFNYLYAKKQGGTFILRIEDTDRERSTEEYERDILESLEWLGLTQDAQYRQSDRTALYREKLQYLIDNDYAYVSNEAGGEGKRGTVIRFRNPLRTVTFADEIVGEVSVDTTDLGDFVIAKDLDTPLYNFVVVVDDAEMNVTHVVRGQDHISNTPRQILIQEALGYQQPVYAHLPLILAPDKTKLSKRHGALPVLEYRDQGYLPEAILNFMAFIGWNPGGEREIYSLDELIEIFDLNRVQKGAGVFNIEKLNWFNKQHLQNVSDETFMQGVKQFLSPEVTTLPQFSDDRLQRLLPELKERITHYGELNQLVEEGDIQYFFAPPSYSSELLIWKKGNQEDAQKHLQVLTEMLQPIADGDFTAEGVKAVVWEYATEQGRGDVLWPMRVALSGKERSPDPFILAGILGKDETLSRISTALSHLT